MRLLVKWRYKEREQNAEWKRSGERKTTLKTTTATKIKRILSWEEWVLSPVLLVFCRIIIIASKLHWLSRRLFWCFRSNHHHKLTYVSLHQVAIEFDQGEPTKSNCRLINVTRRPLCSECAWELCAVVLMTVYFFSHPFQIDTIWCGSFTRLIDATHQTHQFCAIIPKSEF